MRECRNEKIRHRRDEKIRHHKEWKNIWNFIPISTFHTVLAIVTLQWNNKVECWNGYKILNTVNSIIYAAK